MEHSEEVLAFMQESNAVRELRSAFDLIWYNSAFGFHDEHPMTQSVYICAARVIASHVRLNINNDDWSGVWSGLMQFMASAFEGDTRSGVMEKAFNDWLRTNYKLFKGIK
jgi:hypothetical protein